MGLFDNLFAPDLQLQENGIPVESQPQNLGNTTIQETQFPAATAPETSTLIAPEAIKAQEVVAAHQEALNEKLATMFDANTAAAAPAIPESTAPTVAPEVAANNPVVETAPPAIQTEQITTPPTADLMSAFKPAETPAVPTETPPPMISPPVEASIPAPDKTDWLQRANNAIPKSIEAPVMEPEPMPIQQQQELQQEQQMPDTATSILLEKVQNTNFIGEKDPVFEEGIKKLTDAYAANMLAEEAVVATRKTFFDALMSVMKGSAENAVSDLSGKIPDSSQLSFPPEAPSYVEPHGGLQMATAEASLNNSPVPPTPEV